MKSVLVICLTDLKNDARVTRQINFIKESYSVSVMCFDAYPDPKVNIFRVKKTKLTLLRKAFSSLFLLCGMYKVAYKLLHDYQQYVDELRAAKFDLILANDIEALPLAFKITAANTKIFFDAHEYAPRQFEDRLYWRIFFQRFTMALCRKYIPRVDGMSTINVALAREYEKEFGVQPTIITNAAPYHDLKPNPVGTNHIRLVHHGIFNFSRQPQIMVDMMDYLDNRFTLDLIYLLPGSASKKTIEYFEAFKTEAEKKGRIKILPPLKSSEIATVLNQKYDVGIILIPPINFNYQNTLPNKIFDYVQARLGIAIGPTPEMMRVLKEFDNGVVSEDFSAKGLAKELSKLSREDVAKFKDNSEKAAKALNAEKNGLLLLEALKATLSQS